MHPLLWYIVFGGFAILLTDRIAAQLLLALTSDPRQLAQLQTAKGLLFVILSAILFHVLVNLDHRTRQRAQGALRESEERYALAARGANDGLWDWDLKTNQVFFSPRWKLMLGCEEHEVGDTLEEWLKRVHPDDRARVEQEIEMHLQGVSAHFESEHRVLHQDGDYRWMLSWALAVRDETGKAYRMAGSQTDITERKLAEEQLLHNAFYDTLTNLPNRALFMDRLASALKRAERHPDHLFAVLFIDLDRFKISS